MVQVDATDATAFTSTIKDTLICASLPIIKCAGQTYDGTSNMSGRLNGVSQEILNENPKTIYIHCLDHSLSLCLQDSASTCQPINEAIVLTSEIATFIRASLKHLALFESLQKELAQGQDIHNIKPLCLTRWTVVLVQYKL